MLAVAVDIGVEELDVEDRIRERRGRALRRRVGCWGIVCPNCKNEGPGRGLLVQVAGQELSRPGCVKSTRGLALVLLSRIAPCIQRNDPGTEYIEAFLQ
jgi:hypothetical protein